MEKKTGRKGKKLNVKPGVSWADFAAAWGKPAVPRVGIESFTGGLISRKTVSNYDALGKGIPGKFYAEKKSLYPVADVVNWLENNFPMTNEFI